jgi:hypothetical protein
VQEHSDAACMPSIILSCSRELQRARADVPPSTPNWCSMGHDDPRLSRHMWKSMSVAWEALGDHSCDLAQDKNGMDRDNLKPSLVGSSSSAKDKGKGKAIDVDVEEKGESKKRKKSMRQELDVVDGKLSKKLKLRSIQSMEQKVMVISIVFFDVNSIA